MLTRAGLAITLFFSSIGLSAQISSNPHSYSSNASALHLLVTVKTATGAPADNARVELRQLSLGETTLTAYTNGTGVADIASVPGGMYQMTVTYKLAEVQQRANFTFGEHSMTVTLPPDNTGAGIGSSASVSVAAYQVPDKARKEYNKAQDALGKKNNDEAIAHLTKALEIYAPYADALTLRAIIRMDQLDKEGALNDLDTAIKADSSCSIAYFAMGATYNSMDKFDDAIRMLDRGLQLDPKSWQGYFELGKAMVGKGDFKTGIEQMDKAQSMATVKYPPIHLVKAHAMLAIKQYAGAMTELQAFLAEAPNDSRSTNAKETLDKVSAFVARGTVAQK